MQTVLQVTDVHSVVDGMRDRGAMFEEYDTGLAARDPENLQIRLAGLRFRTCVLSDSAKRPEAGAHLFREELRLLPGCEVAAPV